MDVLNTLLLSLVVAVLVTLASKTVELCLTRSSCSGAVQITPPPVPPVVAETTSQIS